MAFDMVENFENANPQKPAPAGAPSLMAVAGVPVGVRNSAGIGELPDDENGRGTVIQGIGLMSEEFGGVF